MNIHVRDGARSFHDLNSIPDDVWERMRRAREAHDRSARDAPPCPRYGQHVWLDGDDTMYECKGCDAKGDPCPRCGGPDWGEPEHCKHCDGQGVIPVY